MRRTLTAISIVLIILAFSAETGAREKSSEDAEVEVMAVMVKHYYFKGILITHEIPKNIVQQCFCGPWRGNFIKLAREDFIPQILQSVEDI